MMKKNRIDEVELDKLIETGKVLPVHLPMIHSISSVIKYQFCSEIISFKQRNNLQQKDIASMIGINKSEVSKLFSYDLDQFSQERLTNFIENLIKQGADIEMGLVWTKIDQQSKKLLKYLVKRKTTKKNQAQL
jgi:predicted XRE-type DNA-binding protein